MKRPTEDVGSQPSAEERLEQLLHPEANPTAVSPESGRFVQRQRIEAQAQIQALTGDTDTSYDDLQEPAPFQASDWFTRAPEIAEQGTTGVPTTVAEGIALGSLLAEVLPEPVLDAPQDAGVSQTSIPPVPLLPQYGTIEPVNGGCQIPFHHYNLKRHR